MSAMDALIDEARVHVVRSESVLRGSAGRARHAPRRQRPCRGRTNGRAGVSAHEARRSSLGRVAACRTSSRSHSPRRTGTGRPSRDQARRAQVTIVTRRCRRSRWESRSGLRGALARTRSPTEVVLVTHDSFAISEEVKQAFESESGLTLANSQGGRRRRGRHASSADGRESGRRRAVRRRQQLLARALEGDVFEPYESPGLAAVDSELVLDPEHRVTPVDHGEVCLNYDKAWYASRGSQPPRRLADVTLAALPGSARRREPGDLDARARLPVGHDRPVRRSAGRGTGASCATTACSSSTAGRRRTRCASPARQGVAGSGRSSSRTRRARPRR